MISFRQLRALVAVADELHFRRAAARIHVSQPALSGQIKELEERLGVQLLERTRSRVLLTAVGKEVVERARIILRDVDELVESAGHAQRKFTGTLRIGSLPTVGPYLLPPIIPELHSRYPALKLYVRDGLQDPLLAGLKAGQFDALIVPIPVKETDLRIEPLFQERLEVAMADDHPLAGRRSLERGDLRGHDVLVLEPGHRLRDQVVQICEQSQATVLTDYEGTSLDAIRQMVAAGMGVAFLPSLYVRSEVRPGAGVSIRPIRKRPPSRTVGMVWRRNTALQDELTEIADVIQSWLRLNVGPEVQALSGPK
ncbi:MAG: LysR substrate-binding domain-containing protein [Alphaproteobacteria bacterium]|nr:LysR substrate-binding domain-containing protein [Alphaproteobacteria bacterium]